ncbi:TetR/AcrR family transcriptional regulator [Frankia sp. AgB1.9]|uniref:TetR/AcrR family transcriptional regulator n=1 Tax=unclassified Frankia TaxID=2632575 RepID=UPI00193232B8|nr:MULTISPECIES: TetR/AcrR family transcriptional regulator [unclassified Frankia]MBL7489395.1 TetR/AcrR family transcriptional regulator [Frankia sp. AgW1.1]MBL7548668.1 TetR/AcrR family transcriptional regulator [Frankia sp. AgB1.9]MBL7619266.1 TetR/AcrR family transcriptional regulator [Frankia sp. AgB1.8]
MTETAENGTSYAPRDRSRSRRQPKDQAGRTQIVDAAVACILELGFYRASSNEIARRAHLSWGAIQYHFGTREALMLAAVEEINRRFIASLAQCHVEGETLTERVESLYDLLAQHYGASSYLASMQIMLNFQHDPNTSPAANEALHAQHQRVGDEIRRLLTETFGPDIDHAQRTAMFHAIRGYAISTQLRDLVAADLAGPLQPEARKFFLAGLVAGAEPTS